MLFEVLASQAVEDAAKSVEQSAGLMKKTINDLFDWLINKSGSLFVALLFSWVQG